MSLSYKWKTKFDKLYKQIVQHNTGFYIPQGHRDMPMTVNIILYPIPNVKRMNLVARNYLSGLIYDIVPSFPDFFSAYTNIKFEFNHKFNFYAFSIEF